MILNIVDLISSYKENFAMVKSEIILSNMYASCCFCCVLEPRVVYLENASLLESSKQSLGSETADIVDTAVDGFVLETASID